MTKQPNIPGEKGASWEVAALFLRLGLTAFGGPAAHIAMMEDEVVHRRKWLDRQEFLDMLGAVNLIPGPNSTELAIYLGYRRAGWSGVALGGLCFILPAAGITVAFVWIYDRYGALPQVAGFLYGIKPVVIAVIVQALWSLARTAIKDATLAIIAVLAAAASFLGMAPLAVLIGGGAVAIAARMAARPRSGSLLALAPPGFGLGKLLFFFLKVGATVYGSGYVLLAFLRADLVERWHWLTQAQLLDAVAVGQFTPGPVFTTATFIGYLLGGLPGAGVATLGIFLPSFLFIGLGAVLLPRLKRSAVARAFLDGVNAAALALMLVVAILLAQSAVVNWVTAALAAGSVILLMRYRWNSAWLILTGGLIGLLCKN